MKIVLAGGTGFIGNTLRRTLLAAGHEVIVLTRGKSVDEGREKLVTWDGDPLGDWAAYFEGADAVVNLAGENIAAKLWTPARKQQIVSSRVDATRAIIQAIERARKRPGLLINASAVGYYGPCPKNSLTVDKDRPNFRFSEIDKYWDGDVELTEASPRGAGFLADVCEQWESEARKAEPLGVRVILARFGPVLGEKGGMLAKMLPPFRFFMGAPLGSGRQWIPWVHGDDVAGSLLFMLEHPGLSGPVNVTAPVPVTMSGFCAALAKALGRPCWFPVPAFLLRLLLGEMSVVVLASQRALPAKLLGAGYRFRYPGLPAALEAILADCG